MESKYNYNIDLLAKSINAFKVPGEYPSIIYTDIMDMLTFRETNDLLKNISIKFE